MKSASLAHKDDRNAVAAGPPPLQSDAQLTQTWSTSFCHLLDLPGAASKLLFPHVQALPLQGSHRQTAGGENPTAKDLLLQLLKNKLKNTLCHWYF